MTDLVISHSGVKERSGRYKWGSGDRPYQRLETARKKLHRIDVKREKKQARADRDFAKAQKRANSIFSNQQRVTKAFETAVESQRIADRLEYKGSKYFQRVMKKIGDMEISHEFDDVIELGNKYIEMVHQNSRTIYNLSLVTGGVPEHFSKGRY